jgi:hypothetical protein
MDSVQARLAGLLATRRQIETRSLLGPLEEAVRMLDHRLLAVEGRVRDFERAYRLAPELLAYDGPRTYLLLTQDNAELFPTGGLISVYALLTIERGSVTRLTFTDVGSLWRAWQSRGAAYVEPPGPLRRYLLRDWSWNLGTSNWSPDFPTAARQAQYFLHLQGGGSVDGVIAVNFITIEALMRALGPLEMPEYGVSLTPENATEVILEQTHNARGQREGKQAFVSKVANELAGRTMGAEPARWGALLQTFRQLAAQKQLFVYLNNAAAQRLVAELGLAGEVRRAAGDYAMVVDTSVHSTKLNLVIDQTIDLALALKEDGSAAHVLTVRYQNRLPEWSDGKSAALLAQMLRGHYGGYVRLLAPAQSDGVTLMRNGADVGLEDRGVESGRAWFGGYLSLPAGHGTSISFRYITPGVVAPVEAGLEYRLLLQKQSGTRALPVTIQLRPPAEFKVTRISLDGQDLSPDGLALKTDLRTDRELVVLMERR